MYLSCQINWHVKVDVYSFNAIFGARSACDVECKVFDHNASSCIWIELKLNYFLYFVRNYLFQWCAYHHRSHQTHIWANRALNMFIHSICVPLMFVICLKICVKLISLEWQSDASVGFAEEWVCVCVVNNSMHLTVEPFDWVKLKHTHTEYTPSTTTVGNNIQNRQNFVLHFNNIHRIVRSKMNA